MICFVCEGISLEIICSKCQQNLLVPENNIRELECGLSVISFYSYEEIEALLKTKYSLIGSRVYKVLAKNSMNIFAKNFKYDEKIYAISVDDRINKGYSHTAILSHELKSDIIVPYFSKLLSQNDIKYAGEDLEFRKSHKKEFKYLGKKDIKAILVDDIVTTGSTLCEAKEVLEKSGVEVLFGIVLADSSR